MAMVDQIGDKLTAQAHPLLSNARKKLIELRKAISENKKLAIQKISRELQQQLQQMAAQKAIVFTKQPLEDDRLLLNQLIDRLPAFYAENPPSQGDMLVSVEAGLAAVNRYYITQEGFAARTGTILQEAMDPVMSRLENLPKTMYDNFRGRTSTEPRDAAPVEEGTVSQFLDNGSSILKTILEKAPKRSPAKRFPLLPAFSSSASIRSSQKCKATLQIQEIRFTLREPLWKGSRLRSARHGRMEIGEPSIKISKMQPKP